MPGLIRYNLIPTNTEETQISLRVYEFNRYLKAITKIDANKQENNYSIDTRAINFLNEISYDNLIIVHNDNYYLNVKAWDKVYQKYMDIIRNWIQLNKEQILNDLNDAIFYDEWIKYAQGSISRWEMDSLCFYSHEHELVNVNTGKYGIMDFFALPESPIVDRSFVKGGKEIKMFKLCRICGTCIAKDKNKSTVTLLTTSGVVTIKFRKEYFSIFDKQISEKQPDGTKKVIEKSWFNRGNMIMVQGVRSGDSFLPKKYASTGGHQLYKIDSILADGDLILRDYRYQGDIEEDV